ncbi:dipeptidase [Salisediminibacterium beveridgei]|uniref:Acetylornithine deacetylase-like/Succinyl-diaminopimelate desuccinylase-like protein n=1 Tax=Salisediminibacterium beveridgei TaxID=632773 RepID=A0A1D7QSM9_9BACI|nr:dipeptidase [Salisediminibacterium beveridgei]AOM81991.1 Acetylornithine deacetylase-like/Succinyl-diaminopimelate desuccinylase-like protein [Salisediminibacterium beveridgei]
MTVSVKQYLKDNREQNLERLKRFLAIPSVSTTSSHKEDVLKAGEFVRDYLNEIGFEKVNLEETGGHPLVYAEWMGAEGAPTALFYGHYDVQPAEPLELWDSEPFQAEVRDERIFARGASDDKGQVFMHLAVFEAFMKTQGALPINVKVIIEGEEEIGSENLNPYLKNNLEKLAADFALVSDSGMVETGQPTMLYGLKGFTGLEVTLRGAKRDLHSGLYGGAVKNPAMALSQLLAGMKNEHEKVLIEGFYDGIEELDQEERDLMNAAPGEDYTRSLDIPETTPEDGFTVNEHLMARPTFEVNGIFGGYQGEGTKTIIPSEATAKLTCRLVPGQDPMIIQDLLVKHIEKHVPKGVHVSVKREPLSAKAYKVDPAHPLIQSAAESLSAAFGKETVFVRLGGSIPVVESFDQLFGIPVILLGFGTPEDNLHAPNESFPVNHFDLGMEVLVDYYAKAAKLN